jgi:hypothetical protein
MAPDPFVTRGGLTYVDRLDFTGGDTLTAVKRVLWPSVNLRVEDSPPTFSFRTGSDTLQHTQEPALPYQPFYGRSGHSSRHRQCVCTARW